jgi:hypothetical protein
MEKSDQITGSRKHLPIGLPGFGCKYCCTKTGRKGRCRIFPTKRLVFASRTKDFYEHVRRCDFCPKESRKTLVALKGDEEQKDSHSKAKADEGRKQFFDRIWARMGRDDPKWGDAMLQIETG